MGIWEEELICPSCGRASRYGLRQKDCKGPMDGLVCHFAYEGLAKKIITEAKYRYYFNELEELAGKCWEVEGHPEFAKFIEFLEGRPIVVPVPLHPDREKERGFNQAEVVGRLVARHWLLDIKDILERVRKTEHQVGKTREERLKAMQGAFAVNSKQFSILNLKFSNKFLLVDDVWTTGATMRECAKTLKKELPTGSQIWGWVIAR